MKFVSLFSRNKSEKILDPFEVTISDDHEEPDEVESHSANKTDRRQLESPRHRCLNNDSTDDFVAIDFETCTSLRTSAISVGMVKVVDAEIVQQFYSIINPIRDEYTDKEPNRTIHGIALKTAEKADSFDKIFNGIRLFIGDLPIVCHNAAVDAEILRALMNYYGLSGINVDNVIDTYALSKSSLSECCKKYGIALGKHHNALSDAEACARIYLELIGKPLLDCGGDPVFSRTSDAAVSREIDKSHRLKLTDDEIENKNTLFFNSTVVITGVFELYPNRDELAQRLQKLGAKVNSSISKKTTYVIVGSGAGPKKIEKIQELQDEGHPIRILREHDLANILKF